MSAQDPFDTRALFAALDVKRRAKGLSWRQVSVAAGMSDSLPLTRIKRGESISVHNLALLLMWYGPTSIRPFVRMPVVVQLRKAEALARIDRQLPTKESA